MHGRIAATRSPNCLQTLAIPSAPSNCPSSANPSNASHSVPPTICDWSPHSNLHAEKSEGRAKTDQPSRFSEVKVQANFAVPVSLNPILPANRSLFYPKYPLRHDGGTSDCASKQRMQQSHHTMQQRSRAPIRANAKSPNQPPTTSTGLSQSRRQAVGASKNLRPARHGVVAAIGRNHSRNPLSRSAQNGAAYSQDSRTMTTMTATSASWRKRSMNPVRSIIVGSPFRVWWNPMRAGSPRWRCARP